MYHYMGGSSWLKSFLEFHKLSQFFSVYRVGLFLNITLNLADLKFAFRSVYWHLSLAHIRLCSPFMASISGVISSIVCFNSVTLSMKNTSNFPLLLFYDSKKKSNEVR